MRYVIVFFVGCSIGAMVGLVLAGLLAAAAKGQHGG